MNSTDKTRLRLPTIKTRWIIIPVVFIALLAFAVVAGSPPDTTVSGSWKQTDVALSPQPVYRDPIEEASLTLRANGFVPRELNLQSNRFFLSIDNRTDVKELVLRLSRADGSLVRELRVAGGIGDWSELFELPEGTYTLSEASHAEWTCTLKVHKT